jgi:hypothetical protein
MVDSTGLKPRRLRIHVSTAVLLLVGLIPYLLVAIPVSIHQDASGSTRFHGWPAIHLTQSSFADEEKATEHSLNQIRNFRTANESDAFHWSSPSADINLDSEKSRSSHWSVGSNWQVFANSAQSKWYFVGLLVNLLTVLAFMAIVVFVLETLRRRKAKWYQLTLMDFAVAAVLISAVFASGLSGIFKSKPIETAANELQGNAVRWSLQLDVNSPVWFDRITDGRFLADSRKLTILGFNYATQGGGFGGGSHWGSGFAGGAGDANPFGDTIPETYSSILTTPVPPFSQVKRFSILETKKLSDESIATVAACQPESLTLKRTDKQRLNKIANQSSVTEIRQLELDIQGHDFDELRKFSSLEKLKLRQVNSNVEYSPFSLDHLELGLYESNNSADVPNWLEQLEDLEKFRFEGPLETCQEFLIRLPAKIHTLHLNLKFDPEDGLHEFDCAGLEQLPALRNLVILLSPTGFGGGASSFKNFSIRMSVLEKLNLGQFAIKLGRIDEPIAVDGFNPSQLPSAKVIQFRGIRIDDATLARLSEMKGLKSVSFNSGEFDSDVQVSKEAVQLRLPGVVVIAD